MAPMENITANNKVTESAKSFGTILKISLVSVILFWIVVWIITQFNSPDESYALGVVIFTPFLFGAVALVSAFYMYFRDLLKRRNETDNSQ